MEDFQDFTGKNILITGGRGFFIGSDRARTLADIGNYYADYSKIRAALNWAPRLSLEVGLA